ncbi:uncharacterized protein LOC132705957 isoform X2 [Cylas formicarius]|uniref:uncharacterized protein LOC132705957 isoform X2 n=1 Tax=Cylas formicarius TaxID=197179 RepID=UPI00295877B5|nr:uncharacterized protein LOC132705957 isoform X2 [Cylas formicarius]
MAPSPDDDNTPKAPDKIPEKQKLEKTKDKSGKESGKDEETLSNLNYKELKALLDEAINYKNPKDREGKSELFNDLLLQAEETERIARATSAGGSELVRHCNPTARRHRHGGPRGRRSTGCCASSTLDGRSVSERGTHGGSLDNLAKEELFESTRRLRGGRKSSTSSSASGCSTMVRVSARQREGGSLPCNVNVGETQRDIHFLEEAKRSRAMREKEYTDMETVGLLENDQLAQTYEEQAAPAESGPKFTSKATWQISGHAANVDDAIPTKLDSSIDSKNSMDVATLKAKVVSSQYNIFIPNYPPKTLELEDKRVDENGNALHQKSKRKKPANKNVVVVSSEMIEGHKKEIINDVQQLVHYIEGTDNQQVAPGSGKTRTVQSSKSKQLHKQHASEDGGVVRPGKKRKSKEGSGVVSGVSTSRPELKKSNSMGEISGLKLDAEFASFGSGSGASSERGGSSGVDKEEEDDEKVVLRINKPSVVAGQRRSWGNVEIPSFQSLYNASSMENLETSTENWVVTRTKKKSKKRRNSVSSAGGRLRPGGLGRSDIASTSPNSIEDQRTRRTLSPDLAGVIVMSGAGAKMTRSMPHSEKSNDSSSDVDSVHSLPLDGPISYADIAKNSEKKKPSPEKATEPAVPKEKSPQPPRADAVEPGSSAKDFSTPIAAAPINKNTPPDVHNIKSFPAITGSGGKSSTFVQNTTVVQTTTTSDKAVQSTIGYDEPVREKTPISGARASGPRHTSVVPMIAASKTPVRPNAGTAGSNASGKTRVAKGGATLQHQQSLQEGQIFYATGDIQTDLSIIQANESAKDSLQFNAQRLPPDVPDVQTIEKMQFMKCMSPPAVATPPYQQQPSPQLRQQSVQSQTFGQQQQPSGQPKHHHQAFHKTSGNQQQKAATQQQSAQAPPAAACPKAGNPHYSGHQSSSPFVKAATHSFQPAQQSAQARPRPPRQPSISAKTSDFPFCDSSEERTGCMVNGVADETVYMSPEPPPLCASPPPVIILSGTAKEVPGLEFGFDINEQLLQEDTGVEEDCDDRGGGGRGSVGEDFTARYMAPPEQTSLTPQSLEKIVNFISSTWESILDQNVQFYSDDL